MVETTPEMSRLAVETDQTPAIVHLLFNKLPNSRQAFMIRLSLATERLIPQNVYVGPYCSILDKVFSHFPTSSLYQLFLET